MPPAPHHQRKPTSKGTWQNRSKKILKHGILQTSRKTQRSWQDGLNVPQVSTGPADEVKLWKKPTERKSAVGRGGPRVEPWNLRWIQEERLMDQSK